MSKRRKLRHYDRGALPLRPRPVDQHDTTVYGPPADNGIYVHSDGCPDECLACDADRLANERPMESCWDDPRRVDD